MNKEFQTRAAAEAFIAKEKLELSATSPVRVRHELGTKLNLTATGAVMVCETRASREARKVNPNSPRTVYLAHQYKANDGILHLLDENPAGAKFNALVEESDRKDADGNPYLRYALTAVTAETKKPAKVGRAN